MKGPTKGEDARNLSLITASGVAGLLLTAGLVGSGTTPDIDYAPTVRVSTEVESRASSGPAVHTGADRIWGRVVTTGGERFEGFIRWDRNEGSWADILDGDKRRNGVAVASGLRFGHVKSLEVQGSQAASVTLRSGERVTLRANGTDIGSPVRAIVVDDPDGRSVTLRWNHLRRVDFSAAPESSLAREKRLYGTLTTRSGRAFTGYVTWDIDEIYSSDVLDGRLDGRDLEIPFGTVASIESRGSRGARVTLRSGEAMTLRGTDDVNSSNSGITVSDPTLGQVEVGWSGFERVRFHEPRSVVTAADFEGDRIRGTVRTRQGEEITGTIRWDDDEAYTWELLNGRERDVELKIEFGEIASIRKKDADCAVVELRDGRTFELDGANDVDHRNRGVVVETENGDSWMVPWADFVELRLSR